MTGIAANRHLYRIAIELVKGKSIVRSPFVYTPDDAHEVVRNHGGGIIEIWVEDANGNRVETEAAS